MQTLPPRRMGANAWQSVIRNLGWMLASRGFVAILSLVYLGIAARTLGVVNFGRFSLIAGAAQVLATVVAFQSWQVIVQFGVSLTHPKDEAKLARLFQGNALLDLTGAVVGTVLAVVILHFWSEAFGIGPTLKRAALIYAVIQVVTIRSAALGILRLRDRFALAAIADSMTPVARLIGAILAMVIHPTLQAFLFVWGVAEVLTALAYWGMVGWTGDFRLLCEGRGTLRMFRENSGLLRFALSTNASSTLGLASKQIPLLVVGSELGVAAAGSFRLAAQLAQALAKLGQLLSRAAFPEIVRAVRENANDTVRLLLLRIVFASSVVGAVIMILAIFAGKPVLKLVGGHAFGHASSVLIWMAAAGSIDLIAVGLDTVMTARGNAGRVFTMRIVGVVVMVVVALLTLPQLGETGMAVAVVAGSLTVTGLLMLRSNLRS